MHFSEFFYEEEINFLAELIIINNDCFSLSGVLRDKIIIFRFFQSFFTINSFPVFLAVSS